MSLRRRPFDFGANHLALDFTNTVNGRPIFTRDDLAGAADIIDWAVAAGIVNHVDSVDGEIDACAAPDSPSARTQFAGAVALREHLYQVFGPLADGRHPDHKALEFVARRSAQAMRSSEWVRTNSGYLPQWPVVSVASICDRIADEAMTLLRSPSIDRVGSCAGCGWLFLDVSRAHARRWCSMNACGVRDKMRRYHQRQSGTVEA